MDSVPKYAAVNECVSMARKRSKGYINAVLRNFIRKDCRIDLPKNKTERMRIEYSAPKALVLKFCEIFGEERAEKILSAFKEIEDCATERLVSMLPADLREGYYNLLTGNNDEELMVLVKAADKFSALIKCIEERKAGNQEFKKAESSTKKKISALKLKEADIFMEEFLPAFELSLDQL